MIAASEATPSPNWLSGTQPAISPPGATLVRPVVGSVTVPQLVAVSAERQAISPTCGTWAFAAVRAVVTWAASTGSPPPSEFLPAAVTVIGSVALAVVDAVGVVGQMLALAHLAFLGIGIPRPVVAEQGVGAVEREDPAEEHASDLHKLYGRRPRAMSAIETL